MKMKNKLIDEMVFDTKNDKWIFISDLKSGKLIYNDKEVKVFTTDRGYTFIKLNGQEYKLVIFLGIDVKKLLKIDKRIQSIMPIWTI